MDSTGKNIDHKIKDQEEKLQSVAGLEVESCAVVGYWHLLNLNVWRVFAFKHLTTLTTSTTGHSCRQKLYMHQIVEIF